MGAKENLKEYLKFKGVVRSHFYKKTGLANGFLDSGTGIGTDKIEIIISHYPDINLEWLILNKGDMINPGSEKPVTKDSAIDDNITHQVKDLDLLEYIREKDDELRECWNQIGAMNERLRMYEAKKQENTTK